jgi:1-acyl-sn-glycerol-3-phosphate acyltransferase
MKLSNLRGVLVTCVLWIYFAGFFVAGYWLLIVIARVLGGRRAMARVVCRYLALFLKVACLLVRGMRIDVPERERLKSTTGTVVVCNHISFLDPLLLLSLIPRVITIVRPDFFRVPFFGWLLAGSGFLKPSLYAEGQPWIDGIRSHLASGGNLLIFPEGTRSRDGKLSQFKKGAFFLAKHLGAPLLVVKVRGTNGVLPPGQWFFNAPPTTPIKLRILACISGADAASDTTQELTTRVFKLVEES